MFSSRDQPFEQKKNRKKRPFQKVDGSPWIHPEVIPIKWHDLLDTIYHNEIHHSFLNLIPNTN